MRGRTFPAVLLAVLCFYAASEALAETKLQQLVRESTFIFLGTVIDGGSSGTAVVRVDRILRSTEFFKDFTGKEVRVTLRQRAPEKGEQTVFFTRGGSLGEAVMVEEIAHFADPDPASLARMLDQAAAGAADAVLLNRLREVDLVISGQVTAERTFKGPERMTEHDPQWREVIITVKETLRGNRQLRRVSVLVPTSMDVMFRGTPRIRQGQEGVFLLESTEEMRLTPGRPTFTALDSIDVQPLSALDRIRRLMLGLQ